MTDGCDWLLMHLQVGDKAHPFIQSMLNHAQLFIFFKHHIEWVDIFVRNFSTVPHALWQIRDFYLYTALKEGPAVLQPGGIKGSSAQWQHDPETFRKWARGMTGFPFVDASMRELAATGWMSNR